MTEASVENLFMSHWGEPSRRAEFDVADSPMAILKWNAKDNPEGVALYATGHEHHFDERTESKTQAGIVLWTPSGTG